VVNRYQIAASAMTSPRWRARVGLVGLEPASASPGVVSGTAAAGPPVPVMQVDFPDVKSYDELYRAQKAYYAKLRGSDIVEGDSVLRVVPRTTVADARELVATWGFGGILSKSGVHNFSDISHKQAIGAWNGAQATFDLVAPALKDDQVYPANRQLWRALGGIAVQAAVTDEAPSRVSLAVRAVGHGIKELPNTLLDAAKKVKDVGFDVAKYVAYAAVGVVGAVVLVNLSARGR
jgi:hypothetical protein